MIHYHTLTALACTCTIVHRIENTDDGASAANSVELGIVGRFFQVHQKATTRKSWLAIFQQTGVKLLAAQHHIGWRDALKWVGHERKNLLAFAFVAAAILSKPLAFINGMRITLKRNHLILCVPTGSSGTKKLLGDAALFQRRFAILELPTMVSSIANRHFWFCATGRLSKETGVPPM